MARDKVKIGLTLEAFDRVTAPLKRINASLEGIRRPIQKLQNSFRALSAAAGIPQLRNSLMRVGSAAGRVGSEIMRLGRNFLIFGGLAAAGLYKIIKGTAETADKLAKLSRASGMSVESLQTLGFAFEQSGGDAEAWEKTVVKFGKGLGELRADTGTMVTLLKKSNPELLKQLKMTEDTGEGMRLVIEAMGKARTAADRMALGAAAFGRGAPVALVNLAMAGKEGLSQLEQQMLRLGVISQKQAESAEPMLDAWNALTKTLTNLKMMAIAPLMPALTKLAEIITEWFLGKKEDVAKWGEDFAEALPGRLEILREHLTTLRDALAPIGRAFKWIAADSGRVKAALAVLAGLIAGKFIVAIALLGKALVGLGITLLTTPIGWFLGIIAALAAIAYVLIFKWDAVKRFFSKMWDTPIGKLVLMMSPITWLVLAAQWLIKNWDEVKQTFVDLWHSPLGKLLQFLTPIDEMIAAGKWLIDNWAPVKKFFTDLFEGMTKQIRETLSWMEKISDPFGIQKKIRGGLNWSVTPQGPELGAGKGLEINRTNNAAVSVRFENMPRGARVTTAADAGMDMSVDTNYLGIQGAPA